MKTKALKAAVPLTLPICVGFLFLGTSYGLLMNSMGFSFFYPMIMSLVVFAGSMEFIAASLLLGAFNPLQAFVLTLMVNARHIFYGISMLDRYKNTGLKKLYLIFGMCDESFSINCAVAAPSGVDSGWFMFFVTLLNHIYWVLGATLGGVLGYLVNFNTEGIEFVMTALFVVMFLNQWEEAENHAPAVIGLVCSLVACLIFGGESFLIPAMIGIVACFTISYFTAMKKEGAGR